MPAFRDADLNTKAHSTSMPTFLAFRLTVFFVIPLHSMGNSSYTCKGHICFSQTIRLPSLSHHLSSPTSGDITWRGTNPQARSHLSFFPGKEVASLPPSFQSLLLVEFTVHPLMFAGSDWLWSSAGGPAWEAPGDVYVASLQAPCFI